MTEQIQTSAAKTAAVKTESTEEEMNELKEPFISIVPVDEHGSENVAEYSQTKTEPTDDDSGSGINNKQLGEVCPIESMNDYYHATLEDQFLNAKQNMVAPLKLCRFKARKSIAFSSPG